MPMVTTMLNEWDPELTKAFAQAREPLPGDQFMASLLWRIERARRIRMWRQIFAVVAVVIIVSFNMRLVLEKMASAVRFAGDFSQTCTELLITPWGWAASMLIGLWVLFRTRPSRR
jgi:hypothetical protein